MLRVFAERRREGPPSAFLSPLGGCRSRRCSRRGRSSKRNKQFCDNSPAGAFATPSGHIRSSDLPLPPLPSPIPRLSGRRAIHAHRDGASDIRHKIRIGEACRKRPRYRCRAIEKAPITSDNSCMIVVDGDRRSDFVPSDRSVRLIAQLPDRDFVHVIVLLSHREPSILSPLARASVRPAARLRSSSYAGHASPSSCVAAPRVAEGEAWWARQDSNLQPDRYERPALTIELQAPQQLCGAATVYRASGVPAMLRNAAKLRRSVPVNLSNSRSHSRGAICVRVLQSHPLTTEGAGNAGCTPHPLPYAQEKRTRAG